MTRRAAPPPGRAPMPARNAAALLRRNATDASIRDRPAVKFGDSVWAKTELAMKNETLAKFVCHNICCVVSAIYERGIGPTFLGLPCAASDEGPRAVIQFPGAAGN